MWVLFGTNYNTVENEPQVYFIGIFDNFALINQKRDELIKVIYSQYGTAFNPYTFVINTIWSPKLERQTYENPTSGTVNRGKYI